MKTISESVGCAHECANHSLQATTFMILDEAGFATRDIMEVTGHRAETSLKNYAKTSVKKLEISAQISSMKEEANHSSSCTSSSTTLLKKSNATRL